MNGKSEKYAFPEGNYQRGLTRLDWFAGVYENISFSSDIDNSIAKRCYKMADAIIAESARVQGE